MKDEKPKVSVDIIVNYFNSFILLSQEEKNLVSTKFHSRLYRKRQYILQEGDICGVFNYVVSGCLRMYKVSESGSTHIIQFATENSWISDMGSFYSHESSAMNIEAIEDSVVLQIKYEDMVSLYMIAPKFDRIFRVLVENSLVRMQERMMQFISTDAKERYETFLKQYPDLANRIPNTYIASFLGITPEFLSKIRNDRSTRS